MKKLLSEERRRSNSDGQKFSESQVLFAQVLKDYNSAIENLRQLHQEKRTKVSLIYTIGELVLDLLLMIEGYVT